MNTHEQKDLSVKNPSQDEIAARAHQIWLDQGCPDGRDMENWLAAESQLRRSDNNEAGLRSDESERSRLLPRREDVPYSRLADKAPLATKVAEELMDPGKTTARSSTEIDL
jgi:DUF2934 family protein